MAERPLVPFCSDHKPLRVILFLFVFLIKQSKKRKSKSLRFEMRLVLLLGATSAQWQQVSKIYSILKCASLVICFSLYLIAYFFVQGSNLQLFNLWKVIDELIRRGPSKKVHISVWQKSFVLISKVVFLGGWFFYQKWTENHIMRFSELQAFFQYRILLLIEL